MARAESSEQPADATEAEAEPEAGETEAATEAADPEQQIQQLEAELEDLSARHARAVADYQNLRRRQAEERREQARLTQKALVLNYLPVLDDLNRALDSVGEHPELAEHPWIEGVRMVQRKFLAVLEAGGVRPIEAEGCAFDPELHEAVSYQRGPEGQVVGVVQGGYAIDGLVVRPAMVLVGNGETDAENGDGGEDGEAASGDEPVDETDSRDDAEG